MGQKVHPNGARVGVIRDWSTRWYANKKTFADTLVSDVNLRKMLMKRLANASVARIDIERTVSRVTVKIHTAKPGVIIGRGGQDIEKLKKEVEAFVGKPASVDIMEIKNPETDAQLVAVNIAQQLEKRISFRRALKQSIQRAMKGGIRGIKTKVNGRLGGAEIARSEGYREGSVPLQTLRANIEYGFAEAHTSYGNIGVKVWIYKGQVLPTANRVVKKVVEGGK